MNPYDRSGIFTLIPVSVTGKNVWRDAPFVEKTEVIGLDNAIQAAKLALSRAAEFYPAYTEIRAYYGYSRSEHYGQQSYVSVCFNGNITRHINVAWNQWEVLASEVEL